MSLHEKLLEVQSKLKAPKSNYNDFGNYSYRSCEDIVEAAKPLLEESGLLMTITDELTKIGDRYYIKATVEVTDGESTISVNGYAREAEKKKGMDVSQITGAASSYARKYALNGMFAIDDNKDADATNKHGKGKNNNSSKKKKNNKSGNSGKNGNKATEKQIKAIFAIANSKGFEGEDMKKYLQDMYEIDSSKELTKKQASITIDALNNEAEDLRDYIRSLGGE